MNVTLRQLGYLAALARHRHFGRAAAACGVSQPALSVQIQELEANLGAVLIERARGRIELTPDGGEVARRARRILAEVDDLVDLARHRGRLLAGPLRLGAIPSVAPYLLPTVLPCLQERHPALDLLIRETQTAVLVDELARGALDVLLLSLPIGHPEIETIRLFDDPFLLAVPAGHPLAAVAAADPRHLEGERLLLLEEGHCLRDQALDYCDRGGRGGLGGFGASSLATVARMVANGLGVTLLPEVCLPYEGRDPRLALRRFAPPAPSRAIGLAWRRSSPRKRDFVELGKLLVACRGAAPQEAGGVAPPPISSWPGNRPPQTSPA